MDVLLDKVKTAIEHHRQLIHRTRDEILDIEQRRAVKLIQVYRSEGAIAALLDLIGAFDDTLFVEDD